MWLVFFSLGIAKHILSNENKVYCNAIIESEKKRTDEKLSVAINMARTISTDESVLEFAKKQNISSTAYEAYLLSKKVSSYCVFEEATSEVYIAFNKSNYVVGNAFSGDKSDFERTMRFKYDEELEKFKAEAFRTHSTGNRVYQQAGAYILMLNTGLRAGELMGLLNSDIDLENKTITIRQAVKLVDQRDGTKLIGGKVKKVGKPKTTTSKRVVPLNSTAIEMVHDLRKEFYFGEDSPLVCDSTGDYANPTNLRKRLYRIEDAAGIETKGLHAFRHTFATKLINGTKCADGSIKTLKVTSKNS